MFAVLLGIADLARIDLSALRIVTNAAAALPEAHVRRAARRVSAGAALLDVRPDRVQARQLPAARAARRRPDSVGRGMPNQEHWLVDDEGRRLPLGCTGELVVRGST